MTIFVRLNKATELESFLGADFEYALFVFNKHKQEGDILAEITGEKYDILCQQKRYREACKQAAKNLELKKQYPHRFAA